jgi:hypothetical protein
MSSWPRFPARAARAALPRQRFLPLGCRLRRMGRRSRRALASRFFLLTAAGLSATSPAWGHGVPDQVSDPPATTTADCGTSGAPLFQSFMPSRRLLASVDLRFRAGGSFPADGATLRIAILRGAEPVGDARTQVSGPLATGATRLVHFDFEPALALEPEGSFLIEWFSTSGRVLSWFLREDNPYANGTAIGCGGGAIPAWDFNFATATPSDAAPPTTTITRGPPRRTRARSALFVFSGSDDLSYRSKLVFACTIDRRPSTACMSPFRVKGLRSGRHTFSVATADETGKVDPTPAVRRWRVAAR